MIAFDDAVGLGVVSGADGATYPFHCTAITDGTRTIAVGTEVSFEVVPARNGRWEAQSLSGS